MVIEVDTQTMIMAAAFLLAFIAAIGGGIFALVVHINTLHNRLREYMDAREDRLREDIRASEDRVRGDMRDMRTEFNLRFDGIHGEVRGLGSKVYNLNIRVATLEGKSKAEIEAEEKEAVKIAAE